MAGYSYPFEMVLAIAKDLRSLPTEQLVLLLPERPPLYADPGVHNFTEVPDDFVELARECDGECALVHNHPQSGPPSPEDLASAWELDCCEIHIVTFDGVLWSLYRESAPLWWEMRDMALSAMVKSAQAAAEEMARKNIREPLEIKKVGLRFYVEGFACALPNAKRTML